jgi:gliding motility-associated lipoprotein GldK
MKKLFFAAFAIIVILFTSCRSSNTAGELTGVLGRKKFSDPEPLKMSLIPSGSYIMGPNDEDAVFAQNAISKTVTVNAFWMDQTEITNNQYRQFVYWVRDSLLRTRLGESGVSGREYFMVDRDGNYADRPALNWDTRIDLRDAATNQILEEMYYPPRERFNGRKEIDVRILNYSYYWVDYQEAAKTTYSDVTDRSSFIKYNTVNVYPDTLVWIRDFTYSFNDPQSSLYFWHPSFDDYPVVGVSWVQATAFSVWRTDYMNAALRKKGIPDVQNYRLPLESEWEYAARGGLALSMYPWGGPYTRDAQGCLLANFKPMRGNYADDGNVYTAKVGSYAPNDYGLYDMAGNVAEWTSAAYHPSAYMFEHDLEPNYEYNAKPDDPPLLKRKVVRGGSWKDIAYFLQTSARDYEYQDSTKSHIGFRNVRSYIGVK